jgi:hypothetical protein
MRFLGLEHITWNSAGSMRDGDPRPQESVTVFQSSLDGYTSTPVVVKSQTKQRF